MVVVDGVSSLVAIVAVALSVDSCHVERKDIPRRSNIDNEHRTLAALAVTLFVSCFSELATLTLEFA